MNRGHFEIDLDEILENREGEVFGVVMGRIQHALFDRAMVKARGNKTAAAEILGISRTTVKKMQNIYYLKKPDELEPVIEGKRNYLVTIGSID